jgi:hypothetical protein
MRKRLQTTVQRKLLGVAQNGKATRANNNRSGQDHPIADVHKSPLREQVVACRDNGWSKTQSGLITRKSAMMAAWLVVML